MRKIGAAILCLLLGVLTIYAEDPDANKLLEETVRLSREVKEFEKTLGLKPTETLSRSVADTNAKPASITYVWIQKYGTLATRRPFDLAIGFAFGNVKEKIPLNQFFLESGEQYSFYIRSENSFSEGAVITLDLAAETLRRRVEVLCHEDIHNNLPGVPHFDNEAVTTALGFLVALAYFDHKQDGANSIRLLAAINRCRKLSCELKDLVNAIETKIFPGPGTLDGKRRIAVKMIYATTTYGGMYAEQSGGQLNKDILEAKLSHDYMYWKYFDDIAGIYEKMRDLPKLIKELNAMPKNQPGGFPQYIETLKTKYGYSPDKQE